MANISAKHEGADPEIDETRAHPSDILDYFRDKAEVIATGDMEAMELNFLDKFEAFNKTAWALTEHGLSFAKHQFKAVIAQGDIHGRRVLLAKPLTYMNLSGQVVIRYADFYKIPVGNILVIHDDLDMAPGRLKLVNGGGAGGHNGVRSLIQFLSTRDFPRLKIGIGRPGKGEIHPDMAVERFVLSPMTEDERRLLCDRMDVIEEGVRLFFDKGPASAMNLLNSVK